jgi:hypothetical protein
MPRVSAARRVTAMEDRVIDWDGENMPPGLRTAPPGLYHLVPLHDVDLPMTEEEETAVREGLDDVKAGRVVPLDEVMRELLPNRYKK